MPRLTTRPPKYALHKASGQAIVKFGGRIHYLGPWNTPESKLKYRQMVSAWSAEQALRPSPATTSMPQSDHTVAELLAAYVKYADAYYLKDGKPPKSSWGIPRPT